MVLCDANLSSTFDTLYKKKNQQATDLHLSVPQMTLDPTVDLIARAENVQHLIYYENQSLINKIRTQRLFFQPLPFLTTLNVILVPTTLRTASELAELYKQMNDLRTSLGSEEFRKFVAIWIYQLPPEQRIFVDEKESFYDIKGTVKLSAAETMYGRLRPIWMVRTECRPLLQPAASTANLDLMIRSR